MVQQRAVQRRPAQGGIYLDEHHAAPEVFPFASGELAIFSRRSPLKEGMANEDAAGAVAIGPNAGVIMVADGCGGLADGEQAARLAIESLYSALCEARRGAIPARTMIFDGIEHANQAIKDLGSGAATTLAVVEIQDDHIRPYHAGDSQILLVGNRGRIKLHTRAHSPVGYAVAAGVLSEDEAFHHEDRHIVSNVLGADDTHIEIGSVRAMAPRDTLLVASDGLFDNLLLDEIVRIVRKGPLEKGARQLAELASLRMESPAQDGPSKPDDLTFILFRIGQ